MDITNYLQNCLFTKSQKKELIFKKIWIGEKQDVNYLKVFGSIISVVLLKEKQYKSDIYKNWKDIFIRYSQDTIKHIYAWASKTQQIFLVSNPYIDKSEERAGFLVNNPLDPSRLLLIGLLTSQRRKALIGKPKPRG